MGDCRAARGSHPAAVAQALVTAPDGTQIRWGEQLDIRPIEAFGTREALTDEAVAGYIARYATKGAECTGTVDTPIWYRNRYPGDD